MKNEPTYFKKRVSHTVYMYNPNYGDDKLCRCGHTYYRHFDPYANMDAVGCKYCGDCYRFREPKLVCE